MCYQESYYEECERLKASVKKRGKIINFLLVLLLFIAFVGAPMGCYLLILYLTK